MKNLKSLLAAACALFAIASCQKPEPETPAQLSVTPAKLTLSATLPARATLKVSCDKAWTVSTEADWLTLSCEGGEGNGEVVVNASLNAGPDGQSAPLRSAPVVFSATGTNFEVNVTQKGEDIVFVADGSAELSADGGKVLVSVRHNVSYSVEIPAEASWITQDATKAVVTDNLSFTVAQNSSVVKREALIALRPSEGDAQVIKVSQAGIPLVFKVDPTEYTASEMGETVEVSVEHNCAYTVNIPSDVTWVTKGAVVEGTTDKVSLVVAANNGDNREAIISFVSEAGTSVDLKLGQWAQGSLKEIASLDDWKTFVSIAESIPADREIKLTADLDFSGYTHTAIPVFNGILDGQGHKIKNWNIKGTQPLVTSLNGTLQNLVVDASCTFTFDPEIIDNSIFTKTVGKGSHAINLVNNASGSVKAETYASIRFGTVAAYGGGYIENCVNNGNFTMEFTNVATGVSSCNYVGGIIGYFSTPSEIGESTPNLKGCVNNGAISLRFNATPKRGGLGGIAGATATSSKLGALTDKGWIVNCTNKGEVTYTAEYGGNGAFNVGGVIGFLEGHIKGCKNYGKVSFTGSKGKSTATSRPAVGGVVAAVCYTIEDCHNYGEVLLQGTVVSVTSITDTSKDQSNQLYCRWYGPSIGGVAAQVGNLSDPGTGDSFIKDCSNEGKVSFDCDMLTTAGTNMCVGGVLGYTNKPVTNCTNSGALTFTSLVSGIEGGGVLGYADDDEACLSGCVNNGKITINNVLTAADGNRGRYCWCGGVVGDLNSTYSSKSAKITITDCENTGDLEVVGGYMQESYSYLGGIIGRGNYEIKSISNCKNSGKLSSELPLKFRAGGIAGNLWGDSMEYCTSTGDLNFPNIYSMARVAALLGHGTPKKVSACSSNARVNCVNASDSSYVSLGFGSVGNTTITWDDVTVGGTLVSSSVARTGLLCGGQVDLTKDSANAFVTIGGNKPCAVSSGTTVNGTAVTAADLADISKLFGWLYPITQDRLFVAANGVVIK